MKKVNAKYNFLQYIIHRKEMSSTQDIAKRIIANRKYKKIPTQDFMVFCNKQYRGRGRVNKIKNLRDIP